MKFGWKLTKSNGLTLLKLVTPIDIIAECTEKHKRISICVKIMNFIVAGCFSISSTPSEPGGFPWQYRLLPGGFGGKFESPEDGHC